MDYIGIIIGRNILISCIEVLGLIYWQYIEMCKFELKEDLLDD